jgi:hypothetical protein
MKVQTSPIIGFGSGLGTSSRIGTPSSQSHGAVAFAIPSTPFTWQNASLIKTLESIAAIHATMRESSGEQTEGYVREARSGGMYGTGSNK